VKGEGSGLELWLGWVSGSRIRDQGLGFCSFRILGI
jgi:hypothetical protein